MRTARRASGADAPTHPRRQPWGLLAERPRRRLLQGKVVLSEAEWLQQLRPQLEHRWRDKHRASLQHAMQPGGGVLDLQRAHPMGRPGHAHTSAPYWRLQHVEPARGFFTTFLGGI